jgi:hypothetical protein
MKKTPELPKIEKPKKVSKELVLLMLAQKTFEKNLKEIDFDISYFEKLKKEQPKLLKALSNTPKNKKIILASFLRGVKCDIASVTDGIKNVFDIDKSIYKTDAYKQAVEHALSLHIQGIDCSRIYEIVNTPDFPKSILQQSKIQNELDGLINTLKSINAEPGESDSDQAKIEEVIKKSKLTETNPIKKTSAK